MLAGSLPCWETASHHGFRTFDFDTFFVIPCIVHSIPPGVCGGGGVLNLIVSVPVYSIVTFHTALG